MSEKDRSYLIRRAQQEDAAAAAAANPSAASAHARLAAEYARRLEGVPAAPHRARNVA